MILRVAKLRRSLVCVLLALTCAACAGSEEEMLAQEVEEVGSVARSQAALVSTCAATSEVKPFQELMIVHPAVLESPEASNAAGPNGGPLSFHGVMSKLASSTDPAVVADFTENWLKSFAVEQQVNGFSVPARTLVLQDVL